MTPFFTLLALPWCSFLVAGNAPQEVRSEDVRYLAGGIELAAELLLPESAAPLPAAVICQGSGDSDRSNSWAAAIADTLADHGLAVLLTDKRGCGASGGSWPNADFHDLAGDALAGVAYLRTRDEVDPTRIGLVGLSQGGWVVPVAASSSSKVAFVVDVSGAAVGFFEQITIEMANTARAAGLSEEHVDLVLELNRLAGRYVRSGDWDAYAALREQALATPAHAVVAGFPDAPEHRTWTFIRNVGTFDPMPYWVAVPQPVLVLYGEEDEADNVPVAESVRRLRFAFDASRKRNAEIVVIPGAGHAFVDPSGTRLMPEFVEALGVWLASTLGQ